MKDTYELINELLSVADTIEMVGDLHKAVLIREGCERLNDLYTIAEGYRKEAIRGIKDVAKKG